MQFRYSLAPWVPGHIRVQVENDDGVVEGVHFVPIEVLSIDPRDSSRGLASLARWASSLPLMLCIVLVAIVCWASVVSFGALVKATTVTAKTIRLRAASLREVRQGGPVVDLKPER